MEKKIKYKPYVRLKEYERKSDCAFLWLFPQKITSQKQTRKKKEEEKTYEKIKKKKEVPNLSQIDNISKAETIADQFQNWCW